MVITLPKAGYDKLPSETLTPLPLKNCLTWQSASTIFAARTTKIAPSAHNPLANEPPPLPPSPQPQPHGRLR